PFEGIERYISEHIHDKLTTSSMAAFFGYARSYFSRKFKSVYNLSPGEYLKTIRMSRAANMLTYGINIAQICTALGYADKKVFSRAFKTYHGISPSEYLKRHKLQP
ncbi:MAG: helix-turn-helix transcriptional regulator, partial [Clostridiales bacterium]|nr:helix-turn-helix transcriptional regulator [Clostridiales bacterium]